VENKPINKALIVDDEPDLCQLAEITLNRMGLNTESANTLADAKQLLKNADFDLCLTDMNLPDGNGIELVSHIQKSYPDLPVAVITAYGNMESAVKALKAGAFDFVSKPIDLQVLRGLVTSAMQLPKSTTSTPDTDSSNQILGNSSVMQVLRNKLNKLARSQAPVFIHGESGCGKELAAKMIHQSGARAQQPFVPVNCGAIPDELMESEFFGHKKGSFTGASQDKVGLFMAADGGTLFLDEVADLPLNMQVKLLRAIQEKSIRAIGEHLEQKVDVRILSASHKNLGELVKQGAFREDLYYRINVIELEIPALRDRSEDIPLLIEFLLSKLAQQNNRENKLETPPSISPQAQTLLKDYPFPGNIRELENILERAITLAENSCIQVEDLHLPETTPATPVQTPQTGITQSIPHDTANLAEQEKNSIVLALEKHRWNKTAAAKELGLSLRQLRYRLQKLNIE